MPFTLRTSAVWSSNLPRLTSSEDGGSILLSSRFRLAAYFGSSTHSDGASVVATTNSSAMSRYGGPRSRCLLLSQDAWHGFGCEDPQQRGPIRDGSRPVCS